MSLLGTSQSKSPFTRGVEDRDLGEGQPSGDLAERVLGYHRSDLYRGTRNKVISREKLPGGVAKIRKNPSDSCSEG
jgi:hypothetical protein